VRCAIVQPSYIPWRGAFDVMRRVDLYVFYDDVQYDRRGWRNRNRIKTPQGSQWLTIPVRAHGVQAERTPIKDIEMAGAEWARRHFDRCLLCIPELAGQRSFDVLEPVVSLTSTNLTRSAFPRRAGRPKRRKEKAARPSQSRRHPTWLIVENHSEAKLSLGLIRLVHRTQPIFRVFARVHPQKKFPHVSLLFLGAVAFVSSLLFRLSTVIAAILATRLLVQFIGQAIGLILLHRRWPPERFPFKMWLYPLPAVLTMCGWAALFWATGSARKWGLLLIGLGILAFLLRAREVRQWPFAAAQARPDPEGA